MSTLLNKASTVTGQELYLYTTPPKEKLKISEQHVKLSMTLAFIRKGCGNIRIIYISEMLVDLQRRSSKFILK